MNSVVVRLYSSQMTTNLPWVLGRPSGELSQSFRAELQGIRAGLDGIISDLQDDIDNKKILICTDSQSSIKALMTGPIDQREKLPSYIWYQLLQLSKRSVSKVTFQFTASHCGIERNELVNSEADKTLIKCAMEQARVPIPLAAIKAKIKQHVKNGWLSQLDPLKARYAAACPRSTKLLDLSKVMNREDMVLSAQLRTGHCKLIGQLRYKIVKDSSPLCRWCNTVNETISHVFIDCLNHDIVSLRTHLHIHDITALYDKPQDAVNFLRTALTFLQVPSTK